MLTSNNKYSGKVIKTKDNAKIKNKFVSCSRSKNLNAKIKGFFVVVLFCITYIYCTFNHSVKEAYNGMPFEIYDR